jgi:hypothetical protein
MSVIPKRVGSGNCVKQLHKIFRLILAAEHCLAFCSTEIHSLSGASSVFFIPPLSFKGSFRIKQCVKKHISYYAAHVSGVPRY